MSAKPCANYGMRKVGGFGIRGWRAHCPDCGFLSKLHDSFWKARHSASTHRCDG